MPNQVEILTEKVAALTQLVNSINTDAKTNDELPLQSPFNMLSKIRVYANSVSEIITPQQMINFILTQTGTNKFIQTTGSTLVVHNLTINPNWQWNIQGNYYFNPANVVVNIPYAAAGKTRIDLIVANKFNTFVRIAGAEVTSPTPPVSPTIPTPSDDTLLAYFLTVTEDHILVPTDPAIGKYLGTFATEEDFEGQLPFYLTPYQYGNFGFVYDTGILELIIYDGSNFQYIDLLGGGGPTRLPWGTFRAIGKGQGNSNSAIDEIGDLFEGGLSNGEWCRLAVWKGGALNNENNFVWGPTDVLPELEVWDDSKIWDDSEIW